VQALLWESNGSVGLYDVFSVGYTGSAAVVSGLVSSGQREISCTMRRTLITVDLYFIIGKS
jgi:hypothetical protein